MRNESFVFQINFQRRGKRRRKLLGRKDKRVLAVGIGLHVLLVGAGFTLLTGPLRHQGRIENLRLARLEKSLQDAQGELRRYEGKITKIEEFRRTKVRWSEILRNLANLSPGGILLTTLEDKGKGQLILKGVASTSRRDGGPEQVAEFVARLGAQGSGFSGARLVSTQNLKTGDVEVVQFEVECAL